MARGRDELTLDDQYEALSDAERRRLLLALHDADPGTWLAVEPEDERRATSLYHVHLPKMADMGLVEVRQKDESDCVRRGPRFARIQPHLRFLDRYREEVADAEP